MSDLAAARPTISHVAQWWVLTVRVVKPTLRNGELLTEIVASIMFTIGFYIPLKQIMGGFTHGMSSYAQYLMPLIAMQAVSFAGVSAAFRSATDAVQGIDRRFRVAPIARLIPLSSRMSASMYRCCLALTVSLVCGHVIGFRFYGAASHSVGFCLLVLFVGASLALLLDSVGAANKNPEATTPLMLPPLIVLGTLSVGLQPVERFPDWVRPFVRDQPISQFVYALRALAGDRTSAAGSVTWSVVTPSLIWAAGLVAVSLPLHVSIASRRR